MSQFEKNLQEGRRGEIFVADWLKENGWGVIPAYDYSGEGKAPKLQFLSDGLVIPDLDICKEGKRIWLEVKTYHGPAYNRRKGVHVHGISGRLYEQYLSVENETGTPVYIAILERNSMELLASRMISLNVFPCQCMSCENEKPQMCRAPQGLKRAVYWDRNEMEKVNKFESLPL